MRLLAPGQDKELQVLMRKRVQLTQPLAPGQVAGLLDLVRRGRVRVTHPLAPARDTKDRVLARSRVQPTHPSAPRQDTEIPEHRSLGLPMAQQVPIILTRSSVRSRETRALASLLHPKEQMVAREASLLGQRVQFLR